MSDNGKMNITGLSGHINGVKLYRGYYTVARRYEFYVRVARDIVLAHENIKFISSSQRVMFFLLYGD